MSRAFPPETKALRGTWRADRDRPPSSRPEEAPRPAPKELGPVGRALWDELAAKYHVSPGGYALLRLAAREAELVSKLEAEIARDGASVKDRFGQRKPHPSLAALRDARSGLRQSLVALIGRDPSGGLA